MCLQFLQDFIGLVCFESVFLLVHPRFLFRLRANDGFAGGTEVVAHMKEINQVATLGAELIFHLISYPGCSVTYVMNWRTYAKPGLHSTVKEALPCGLNASQEGAPKGQRLAPLRVRKTYLCLFPVQLFTFALVRLGGINVYDRHHATVHLDNDCPAGAHLGRPSLAGRSCLEYISGVSFSNAGNGAFTQHNTIVLNEFIPGFGKGLVSAEVGHCAL